MGELETRAGRIVYDERGEGPPLVLLHAGAHSRHDFDELRALLPQLRTIAPDWPSHGDSPAAPAPLTAMACADAAEELVATLAPRGAIVLGNSVGGFAAARLAVRRPELVAGLVLVDSGGFQARTPAVRAFCRAMSHPAFLRRIYPGFARRYVRPRTDADRRVLAAAVDATRREPGLSAVCALWRSFSSPAHDLRREAGSIAAPTLVVWGRRDPVMSPRVGRRLAAALPSSRLVQFETGHTPQTGDPGGLAAALGSFAAELSVPAGG